MRNAHAVQEHLMIINSYLRAEFTQIRRDLLIRVRTLETIDMAAGASGGETKISLII
jgi:hypothetical protein